LGVTEIVRLDALPCRSDQVAEISCGEVMRAYLDHIEQVNPQVNAIVSMRDPV